MDERAEPARDGTTVLDVGCGDGGFLLTLPEGIRRIGVDIDQPSIDRATAARGTANAEFHASDFESFQLDEEVDVITLFHVLEHLPAPRAVLEHLRAISKPTTRLLVEVPILEHAPTRDINGFFSVYHLTHFSRGSLEDLLGLSGWQVTEIQIQSDHNGCRVTAVPGSARGRAPNSSDRRHLYRYLSSWYDALEEVETRLAVLDGHDSIAIWGAGIHLEFLYQFTSLFRGGEKRRFVVLDSDTRKQGTTWRGIPIQSPEAVTALDWRSVPSSCRPTGVRTRWSRPPRNAGSRGRRSSGSTRLSATADRRGATTVARPSGRRPGLPPGPDPSPRTVRDSTRMSDRRRTPSDG